MTKSINDLYRVMKDEGVVQNAKQFNEQWLLGDNTNRIAHRKDINLSAEIILDVRKRLNPSYIKTYAFLQIALIEIIAARHKKREENMKEKSALQTNKKENA